MSIKIKATIRLSTVNPYIKISKTRAQKIKSDWKDPMPVLVRINTKPQTAWKTHMMPFGDGSFHLYLNGRMQKVTGTKTGNSILAEISFDERYNVRPMLPLFRSALTKNVSAKRNWAQLAPSRKKKILKYLLNLKSEKAQERNVKKAIFVLSGNRSRFMARSWNDIK